MPQQGHGLERGKDCTVPGRWVYLEPFILVPAGCDGLRQAGRWLSKIDRLSTSLQSNLKDHGAIDIAQPPTRSKSINWSCKSTFSPLSPSPEGNMRFHLQLPATVPCFSSSLSFPASPNVTVFHPLCHSRCNNAKHLRGASFATG